MFDYSQELLKVQENEKALFSNLESRWLSLPETKREQITELIEQIKSRGAICSKYDFV